MGKINFRELPEVIGWQSVTSQILHHVQSKYPEIYNRQTELSYNWLPNEIFKEYETALNALFNHYSIKCVAAAMYITYNKKQGDIHCDNTDYDARINLPVLNCQGSFTEFYTVSKSIYYTNTKYTIKIPDKESENTLIEKLELKMPTVMRVNEFHAVNTGNNVPRISLTLSFDRDPIFLLE